MYIKSNEFTMFCNNYSSNAYSYYDINVRIYQSTIWTVSMQYQREL